MSSCALPNLTKIQTSQPDSIQADYGGVLAGGGAGAKEGGTGAGTGAVYHVASAQADSLVSKSKLATPLPSCLVP